MTIIAKVELRRQLKAEPGSVKGAVYADPHAGTLKICVHANTISLLLDDVPDLKAALDEIVAECDRYLGDR